MDIPFMQGSASLEASLNLERFDVITAHLQARMVTPLEHIGKRHFVEWADR